MANELNFPYIASLTMEAAIYAEGWVQQGTNISMSEIGGATGLYVASVPGSPALADGEFIVLFVDVLGGGQFVGSGDLFWSGGKEDRRAVQGFIEGGRNIDFVGNDTNGWQRIERDVAGVELRRYNLFDDSGNRITLTPAAFLAAGKMISSEVAI